MDSIIKVDSIEFTMTKYFQFEGITQSILDRFKVQVNHDGTEDLEINYSYLDGSVKTCRPLQRQSGAKTIPNMSLRSQEYLDYLNYQRRVN